MHSYESSDDPELEWKGEMAQPGTGWTTREAVVYYCPACEGVTQHPEPVPEKGAAVCKHCGSENEIA